MNVNRGFALNVNHLYTSQLNLNRLAMKQMIEPIEIESFDYNYVYLGTYIFLRVGNVNLEM